MDALTISAIIGGVSTVLIPAVAKAYIEIMKARQAQRIIMENSDMLDSDDPEAAERAKKAVREYKEKHTKKSAPKATPPAPPSAGAAVAFLLVCGLSLSSCASTAPRLTKETVCRNSSGSVEWVSVEFPEGFPTNRESYEVFAIEGHPHVFVVNGTDWAK